MIEKTQEETDTLLAAIISLYLKLIKNESVSKQDINVLYDIFQTTFRDAISLQQIQKTIQHPLELTESVEVINKQLTYPDKIKLLINLLLIAHISEDFSIPARLDIL